MEVEFIKRSELSRYRYTGKHVRELIPLLERISKDRDIAVRVRIDNIPYKNLYESWRGYIKRHNLPYICKVDYPYIYLEAK